MEGDVFSAVSLITEHFSLTTWLVEEVQGIREVEDIPTKCTRPFFLERYKVFNFFAQTVIVSRQ